MSVNDLVKRVNAITKRVNLICKECDKYDVVAKYPYISGGDDVFARLYTSVESIIESALQKAEIASIENNRASAVAAINADIRRTKAKLLEEEVPKLQKLAVEKVKGLSTEELVARNDLVLALPDRIQAIPDGYAAPPKPSGGGWGTSAPRTEINCDSDGKFDDEYFQQTGESSQFRQEYEMPKIKQDQGLDVIGEGLDTLKNMARDMNEELDGQVPQMDEIDTKKAEIAYIEKNRASAVAINADTRRTKAKLLEGVVPKLQKLAVEKRILGGDQPDEQPKKNRDKRKVVRTLLGQLNALDKLYIKYDFSKEEVSEDQLKSSIEKKIELLKGSQFYNLLRDTTSSSCSRSIIQVFSDSFDKDKKTFKIKGLEINYCSHQVAKILSIKSTGIPVSIIEGGQGKLPDYIYELKELYVTEFKEKEKKSKDDKEKYYNKAKVDLSTRSLIIILQSMDVKNDIGVTRFKELMRLFILDQIFFPSSEKEYIRGMFYEYCVEEKFESFNWAQATLDRIYFALQSNNTYFDGCSNVFQALIYDSIPKLAPTTLYNTKLLANSYPGVKKNAEEWTSHISDLNPEDIIRCVHCSQHDRSQNHCSQHDRSQHDRSQNNRSQHDRSQNNRSQHDRSQHNRKVLQKAAEEFYLTYIIQMAREEIEGSFQEEISGLSNNELIKELKNRCLGSADKSDLELLESFL